jgi:hypothetical protein
MHVPRLPSLRLTESRSEKHRASPSHDRCARVSLLVVAVILAAFTPVIAWAAATALTGNMPQAAGSTFTVGGGSLVVQPSGKCVLVAVCALCCYVFCSLFSRAALRCAFFADADTAPQCWCWHFGTLRAARSYVSGHRNNRARGKFCWVFGRGLSAAGTLCHPPRLFIASLLDCALCFRAASRLPLRCCV